MALVWNPFVGSPASRPFFLRPVAAAVAEIVAALSLEEK
jgi:hypothetical protein